MSIAGAIRDTSTVQLRLTFNERPVESIMSEAAMRLLETGEMEAYEMAQQATEASTARLIELRALLRLRQMTASDRGEQS